MFRHKHATPEHTIGIEVIDGDLRDQHRLDPRAVFAVVERLGSYVKVCATDADLRVDLTAAAAEYASTYGAKLLEPKPNDLHQVIVTDQTGCRPGAPSPRHRAVRAFRFILANGNPGRVRVMAAAEAAKLGLVARRDQTIEVCVRDRSAEAPWGVGLTNPVVRRVTISAYCPACGGPRGERRGLNQCDDGAYYWVEVWDNPCGHVDRYEAVVVEAERLTATAAVSATTATPGGTR